MEFIVGQAIELIVVLEVQKLVKEQVVDIKLVVNMVAKQLVW